MTRLGEMLLFGYFLLGQYLHFQLNKQLQSMVCCSYFINQKELGVDVLDFQFELGYFGYSLGYIFKYWANFCSIFLSLWPGVYPFFSKMLHFNRKYWTSKKTACNKCTNLFCPTVSDKFKKFYNIGTLSQCYKTSSFVTESGANKLRCLSQT